jgi:TonB family protein
MKPIIYITIVATVASALAQNEAPLVKPDMLLHAPAVQYPYEARTRQIVGSGTFLVKINPGTGFVTNVTIIHSTGSPILDNACLSALKKWQFKPQITKAVIPVSFLPGRPAGVLHQLPR